MTEPTPRPPRARDWWIRPKVVLPLVGAIALLVALLTPEPSLGRFGDARLSAHLTGALGAAALARTAQRFGFQVSLRDGPAAPDSDAATGATIHAVLAPPRPMTPRVAHRYLERVRAGDALLYVISDKNPLADSLGVETTRAGAVLHVAPADSAGCRTRRDFTPPLWADGRAHLYGVIWKRGMPADRRTFGARADPESPLAARYADPAAGIPFGRGRVVVVADPDLLRNDVLRHCRWAADVLAMRMLEWLRAGGDRPRDRLVFDEYDQGFGHDPSLLAVMRGFLVGEPVGRAVLALGVAGLVLLLAAGPRPLPPVDRGVVERRDPLEQVAALGQAYEQVGASRTAVARLVRAVRDRVEGPAGPHRLRSDADFLGEAALLAPPRGDDAALVARALREPVAARDLPGIAAALRRLEDSLTPTHA